VSPPLAVIGAGAWGIALALQAARTGREVILWSRRPQERQADGSLRRLPGVALPPSVRITDRLAEPAELTLLAVPMQHLREVAGGLALAGPLVACCKGLERQTRMLPLELLAGLHPSLPRAVLSGPNFAGEVARLLPAASVVAADEIGLARDLAARLGSENFRLYASADPVGVQLGGAAKNVIAIAAGAAIGAALGENARASLITRGVAELSRLIVAAGGRSETASGLSGVGDLVLTCTGSASRNYSLGLALGRGERLADILAARSTVAEGVETAPALAARAAELGASVPIIETVSALLAGRLDFAEARSRLLRRPAGVE